MKRTSLNLIVDTLTALAMLGLIGTGIVLRFVLPPRSGSGIWLWGMGRHEWGDVHLFLAVAMTGLACAHVALHWSWVLGVLGIRQGGAAGPDHWRCRPVAIGMGSLLVLAALLAGFWALAARQVRGTRREPSSRSSGSHDGERPSELASISGSMSLDEVAVEIGMALDDVRRSLGLPSSVSGSERLGRLAGKYGFTMSEARLRLATAGEGQSD